MATYWVSPTGAAPWASASGATPLEGVACCSLNAANTNAAAGDTIYFRAGTYTVSTGIVPSNSGTSANKITFAAYTGETPIIISTDNTNSNYMGVYLDAKSYIVVNGITFHTLGRSAWMVHGSAYNEFDSCTFYNGYEIGIKIYNSTGTACTHNWLHSCTVHDIGHVSTVGWDDCGYLIQIGNIATDGDSGNNTIENCTFYHGGHHCIETYTRHNVIKNNKFHNEGFMDPVVGASTSAPYEPDSTGHYGNRCLTFDDINSLAPRKMQNLAEGNRFGHAGRPPDDDGADAVELASHYNIFRYNYIFNPAKDGIYLRDGAQAACYGCFNHVYNNTIYLCGVNEATGYTSLYRRCGIVYRTSATSNSFINNIVYGNYRRDIGSLYPIATYNNTFTNNWLTSGSAFNPGFVVTEGLYGDPKLMNTDVSDATSLTLPDLRIYASSSCVDAGTYLTLANGAGTATVTLVVDNVSFFQDGTWGSSLTHGVTFFPDYIAIGVVGNTAKISAVDYTANTITLATANSWADNAPIWLYKDSDGDIVLYGTSPDIGAYEYYEANPHRNKMRFL